MSLEACCMLMSTVKCVCVSCITSYVTNWHLSNVARLSCPHRTSLAFLLFNQFSRFPHLLLDYIKLKLIRPELGTSCNLKLWECRLSMIVSGIFWLLNTRILEDTFITAVIVYSTYIRNYYNWRFISYIHKKSGVSIHLVDCSRYDQIKKIILF